MVRGKTRYYGLEDPPLLYVEDKAEKIAAAIRQLIDGGSRLLVVTGGMSVDPDDVTPAGIRLTGAETVNTGAGRRGHVYAGLPG